MFTSFCLRYLCSQADSLHQTGAVLAGGKIMEDTSQIQLSIAFYAQDWF